MVNRVKNIPRQRPSREALQAAFERELVRQATIILGGANRREVQLKHGLPPTILTDGETTLVTFTVVVRERGAR